MGNSTEDLSQLHVSEEEKDKLVAEVIRYILFKTHQCSGGPIKRDELVQLVTKNYRQWSLPSYIIKEASKKLSDIFGYELRELQRCRPSANHGHSSQSSGADVKSYVLISQLSDGLYKKYVNDNNNSHATGFSFAVLGVVYLAGRNTTEENLWHHLKRLGLDMNEERHPVFGNMKQTLESLVQQRYLWKDKVSGPEGTTVVYELAERALDEPFFGRLKGYISEIFEKDTVEKD